MEHYPKREVVFYLLKNPYYKIKSRRQLLQLADLITVSLRKLLIVLLILIICSQALLQNETIRHWITGVDQEEGIRLN